MMTDEFRERSDRVHAMYSQTDPARAWDLARSLRIDYVYVDEIERAAHNGAAVFDADPARFERVFDRGEVGVYRVR
jgi:uncharacterized membrane protein